MYGYNRDELIGMKPSMVSAPGMNDLEIIDKQLAAAFDGIPQQLEFWGRRKSGEVFPKEIRLNRGSYFGQDVVIALAQDIAERKKTEETLKHLAHHDTLTGLPNRSLLIDRVEQAIHKGHRNHQQVGILFIDLDRFKQINDSLGHTVGDNLLQAAAKRLQATVRDEDTVARLGGDEFVILIEDTEHANSAAVVAQKVIHSLKAPFSVENHQIHVSGSVGISFYPQDGQDSDTLLQKADAAMYKAKKEGRNTFRFFTEGIAHASLEHVLLESKLRNALTLHQFFISYQPLIDLASRPIVGVEAVLGWEEPALGLVPPDQFIPLAEETGLISSIGDWLVREASRTMQRWIRQGLFPASATLSVNIASRQLTEETFADELIKTLVATGLPPHRLELELTEGALMKNLQLASCTLQQLRNTGMELTINDFGTGGLSLSHLKQLPITKLKINRSFIRNIFEDANDGAITQAIIALGSYLQLTMVADGIETPEQEAFLKQEGCNQGQGILYSKPLSEAVFEKLLLDTATDAGALYLDTVRENCPPGLSDVYLQRKQKA